MQQAVFQGWESITSISIGIIISMVGFWLTFGRKLTTKDEVSHMIETQSPYLHDRQFIMERLSANKETQAALTNMLQKNTEVMNELKIQIATLGKTLEALETRIENHK